MVSERKSRPWREHLKPSEIELLEALQQEARLIDSRRRQISVEMQLLRQRGGQRWADRIRRSRQAA